MSALGSTTEQPLLANMIPEADRQFSAPKLPVCKAPISAVEVRFATA
jgi:hypothetical protein